MTAIDDPAAMHALIPEGAPCIPRALTIADRFDRAKPEHRCERWRNDSSVVAIDGTKLRCAAHRAAFSSTAVLTGSIVSVTLLRWPRSA